MLLARGEREHETTASLFVVSLADKPPGNLARVLLARRKEPHVWTTKRQWYAKRLSFSDDDVSAASTRRLQQSERQRFGNRYDEQHAFCVCRVRERRNIFDASEKIRRQIGRA